MKRSLQVVSSMRILAMLSACTLLVTACPPKKDDPDEPKDAGGQDASVVDSGHADAASGADASGLADAATTDASVNTIAVVINEIMAINSTTLADEQGEFDDWVELFNPGATAASLEGVAISDDPTVPQRHVFGAGVMVPAGGYLLLWADGQSQQGAKHLPFKLSGDGETLVLTGTNGSALDQAEFGVQQADVSMGRFPNGTGSFIPMTVPTPGQANTNEQRDAGASLDAAVSDASAGTDASVPPATGVVINEILASNVSGLTDEFGEAEDWIELFNTTDGDLVLASHHLSDTPATPILWTFPEGSVIPAHGFLVIFADNQPEQGNRHAALKLSATGESVVFSAPDGTILDTYTFGQQSPDVSIGRAPDGTGAFTVLSTPTPGAANGSAVADGGVSDAG